MRSLWINVQLTSVYRRNERLFQTEKAFPITTGSKDLENGTIRIELPAGGSASGACKIDENRLFVMISDAEDLGRTKCTKQVYKSTTSVTRNLTTVFAFFSPVMVAHGSRRVDLVSNDRIGRLRSLAERSASDA